MHFENLDLCFYFCGIRTFGKIAAILWRYQMQEGEQEERFHGSVVFIGDQCA